MSYPVFDLGGVLLRFNTDTPGWEVSVDGGGTWTEQSPGSDSLQYPAGAANGDLFARQNGVLVPVTPATIGYVLTSQGAGATPAFAAPATKTLRLGHSYLIPGEIKVAAGGTDFILPHWIKLAAGQSASLVAARYQLYSGTSATVKLTKNGVDIAGFTGMVVGAAASETDPADVVLANNDMLAPVVTGVVGTPTHMSLTLFIDYTI